MSSLNEYLAKHYGSSSSSSSDKKRKSKKAGLNVVIADDDDDRVYSTSKPVKEKTSKPKKPTFKSTQQSWRTIRESNADEDSTTPSPAKYGLLTSDMIKEETDRVKREQAVRRQKLQESQKNKHKEETIYRDSQTGKRIDVEQVQRDEHQQQADQRKQQQLQAEWNRGLAQQRAELEDRRLEEEMRSASVGELEQRYARERDQELKDRQHWDDPALKYLEKKKKRKNKEVYPIYQGYAPPNRFDIRPGYRWDGVDRSNGFEKQYFRRQASTASKKADDYSASVVDW